MAHKFVCAVDILEFLVANLCNDGTELTTGRGNAMGSRAIPCGENFTRYDERCRVRPKVLEEEGETKEDNEAFRSLGRSRKFLVAES